MCQGAVGVGTSVKGLVITEANPSPKNPDDLEDDSDNNDGDGRLRSLHDVRGDALVVILKDAIIAKILDVAGAMGETKITDPSKVVLEDKQDLHLYTYLVTMRQGSTWPCLVF